MHKDIEERKLVLFYPSKAYYPNLEENIIEDIVTYEYELIASPYYERDYADSEELGIVGFENWLWDFGDVFGTDIHSLPPHAWILDTCSLA